MIPKFRAFDKESKTMRWVEALNFYQKEYSWINDDYIRAEQEWMDAKLDSVILMRSTGLKDKNGVEIYEGDIVEYFHEPAFIKKVKGGFAIVNTKDYEYTTDLHGHMKVLGNIYENPELLEGLKEMAE